MAKIENLKARLAAFYSDAKEDLQESKNKLLQLTKPSFWNPMIKDNLEVRTEREFENLMIVLSEHKQFDKNKITIFELYSLKNYILQKQKNG